MEISEDDPVFGLVSTRMVSVLKPSRRRVSDGALTFVGAKNKPAFAGGVRFGCQPGLFVELVIDPVPSGEYPYSQCENQYKENGKDDTSDARSSFWHGSRRWRGWNRSERRGDGG